MPLMTDIVFDLLNGLRERVIVGQHVAQIRLVVIVFEMIKDKKT